MAVEQIEKVCTCRARSLPIACSSSIHSLDTFPTDFTYSRHYYILNFLFKKHRQSVGMCVKMNTLEGSSSQFSWTESTLQILERDEERSRLWSHCGGLLFLFFCVSCKKKKEENKKEMAAGCVSCLWAVANQIHRITGHFSSSLVTFRSCSQARSFFSLLLFGSPSR